MNIYRGHRGKPSSIEDTGTRWRWVVSSLLGLLCNLWTPFVWHQSSGRLDVMMKEIQTPARIWSSTFSCNESCRWYINHR